MTTTARRNPDTAGSTTGMDEHDSGSAATGGESGLDLARLFPADPELMASIEGDKKGLRRLQDAARAHQRSVQSDTR